MRGGNHERPNVLWIMTDEQRADSLGCYGNSWAQTPNLDQLGATGARFADAHCQSPVCVPSRASMLTGLYAHECEVLENYYHLNITSWHRRRIADAMRKIGVGEYDKRCTELEPTMFGAFAGSFTNDPTRFYRKYAAATVAQVQLANELGIVGDGPRYPMFPELFADAGYRTANIGKLHHGGVDPGFQENPDVPQLEHAYWFGLRKRYDPSEYGVVQYQDHGAIFAGTFPAPAEETETHKWTQMAIEWLRRRDDRPFLLRLSLRAPHTPVLPPEPWDRLHDPADMPAPVASQSELVTASRYDQVQEMPRFRNRFTKDEQEKTWAAYHGLVSHVDYEIGRILGVLDELGLRKNTVVLFNSDHGTLLGEHDIYQKEVFFKEATQVPLIISFPGAVPSARVVQTRTELIDVAPTLLSLAGITVPTYMRGSDLATPSSTAGTDVSKAAFSELHVGEADERWLSGEPDGTVRRSIVTGEWRLTINWPADPLYGPDGALYNLLDDPGEHHNLYGVSLYREVIEDLGARIADFASSRVGS